MQLAIDISLPNVLNLISQMDIKEIEDVKNLIIKKELYFKKFQKDNIENIMEDFKEETYSESFLADLEDGLKKSSLYK